MAIHLVNDLLPNLLNVSGAHVMTATACFDGGATRVATYERMDGSLVQLLLATNGTDPLRFVPPRRDRACFALTAVHQMLRGLAAAHAVGIVNQDVHAGNLLFKGGAGHAVEGLGLRAGLPGRPRRTGVPVDAGALAAAPGGRVALTPASDIWGAGLSSCYCGRARARHRAPPWRRGATDRLAARSASSRSG